LTFGVNEIRRIGNISTKNTQIIGKKFVKKSGGDYFGLKRGYYWS